MQDKENNVFEDSFVNLSWQKMSVILDKSLPQQTLLQQTSSKKRNDKLVWLLALLFLISTAVASYLAYKLKTFIPSAALTKEKIIYKNISN